MVAFCFRVTLKHDLAEKDKLLVKLKENLATATSVRLRSIFFFTMNSPANIYLSKVYNRIARKRCEICSKLTIKVPERRHSGVFIVNFEHISHLFLVLLF